MCQEDTRLSLLSEDYFILKAKQDALLKNARLGAAMQLAAAAGAILFMQDIIFDSLLKLFCIGIVIVVNSCRLFLNINKKKSENEWINMYSFIVFLIAIAWSVFFIDLAVCCKTNLHLIPFAFLGPMGLCSASFLTMSASKRIAFLFQVPLIASLLISFYIVYQNSQSMFIGFFSVTIFSFYAYKSQKKLNQSWIDLQVYTKELQDVIDSVPGGITVVRNGCYVKVNSYVTDILLSTDKNLIQRPINQVYPESEFTMTLVQFMNSKATRSQHEFSLPTVAGIRTHYVIFRKLKIKKNREEIIITSLDIEDLKQAQKDLEKQQAKMEYNSKMASLGEMSSGLAHEINNPLAIISARIQILQSQFELDKYEKVQIAKSVETIMSMTMRIAKIIKSLKLFARDSSSDSFESTSLSDIVDETISLCEMRAFKFSAQVEKIGSKANFIIDCLPTQISQVILNALNNSFDAISELPVKWIKLELVDEDTHVRVEITDSGSGIAKDIQDKVMVPFFTTKAVGSGTGLGLSLSKGIIENHHGQIFFDHESINTKLILILPKTQPTERKKSN